MTVTQIENYKEIDFFEKLKMSMTNIYHWTAEDNKPIPPDMKLPAAVIERIQHFTEFLEDGLTFQGAMQSVLAYDEEESKREFCFGMAEEYWLPVSEEFKEWRDEMNSMHEIEIAVAIIYGGFPKEEGEPE
jgi:hypothetical protein